MADRMVRREINRPDLVRSLGLHGWVHPGSLCPNSFEHWMLLTWLLVVSTGLTGAAQPHGPHCVQIRYFTVSTHSATWQWRRAVTHCLTGLRPGALGGCEAPRPICSARPCCPYSCSLGPPGPWEARPGGTRPAPPSGCPWRPAAAPRPRPPCSTAAGRCGPGGAAAPSHTAFWLEKESHTPSLPMIRNSSSLLSVTIFSSGSALRGPPPAPPPPARPVPFMTSRCQSPSALVTASWPFR
uniref:Uncharacterized protein n=1 Tax=Zea mays TaxID=4577 RepID=C4J4X5_MAIZE|nr:unknown [Zea mays]